MTVFDRRHSDAALLVLAVAALALVLVATLGLHRLVVGDEDQPQTAVLVDHTTSTSVPAPSGPTGTAPSPRSS